ncbi:MAG: ATP-binding protein, partial [Ruaniaceae bacterium]|nr:ATP-binding protein [Ruaniaceae bacterium]
ANYTDEALDEAVAITGGYPYFIQELGYAVWMTADNTPITREDIRETLPGYEAKLDESFFRVRLDRATALQRSYLRAMAGLGPHPQKASDVADAMERKSQNLGPTRAELIAMGLLYTPEHGYAAFTVPHFDPFLLRAIPELEVPERRVRRAKKS